GQVVERHDARQLGDVGGKTAKVVVVAVDLERDRHLGIEVPERLLARLEQFEPQAAFQAGLDDVGQQAVHLRAIRQLLEQIAEGALDLDHLLLVGIEIDRLGLLDDVDLTQLRFAGLGLLKFVERGAPQKPVGRSQYQQAEPGQQYRFHR